MDIPGRSQFEWHTAGRYGSSLEVHGPAFLRIGSEMIYLPPLN